MGFEISLSILIYKLMNARVNQGHFVSPLVNSEEMLEAVVDSKAQEQRKKNE